MADVIIQPWVDAGDPDGLKYSMNRFQCDGTANVFEIHFAGEVPGYISKDYVRYYTIDANTLQQSAIADVPSSAWQTDVTIKLEQTPGVPYPTGVWMVIFRDTPKEQPLVDFTDGAVINEENLDLGFNQAISVAAEMVDRFDEILDSNQDVLDRLAEVEDVADAATATANAATATANAATATANAASTAASAAVVTADAAEATADNALSVANGIDAKATQALADSAAAVSTANNAESVANAIDAKAQTALDNSEDAVATADAALLQANGQFDNDVVIFGEAARGLHFRRGTKASPGSSIWFWYKDGSQNMALRRYDASGVFQNSPISISYGTGAITVAANIAMSNFKVTGLGDPTAATDAANKQYVDAAAVGLAYVRGLVAVSGGGGTSFNLGCTWAIQFWNPTTKRVRVLVASITGRTQNIATAGPTVNGRDQAAAFPNGSAIHIYFIHNPSTGEVGTLSSLTYGTPTLPAGFTECAYAFSTRMSGSNLMSFYVSGATVYFTAQARVLNNGQSKTTASVSCTAYVPSTAVSIMTNNILEASPDTVGPCSVSIRPTSGAFSFALEAYGQVGTSWRDASYGEYPNINGASTLEYAMSYGGLITSGGAYIDLVGYRVPNGDN